MADLSFKDQAKLILDKCSGPQNIVSATNCMTRLRLVVKDESKVDIEGIKKISGILSVIHDGNSVQVVIGPGKVKKVADEFTLLLQSSGVSASDAPVEEEKPKKKELPPIEGNAITKPLKHIGRFIKNIQWQKGFRHIGNIFSPLVRGFIAFGVLYSISCIIQMIGQHGDTSIEVSQFAPGLQIAYYIFFSISQGFIAYLSVLVGVYAAKEFKVTPVIGGAIGGLAIFDKLIEISKLIPGFSWEVVAGKETITKGLIMAGNGGVIAVILAVFLIGFLERWIKKWMPDILDTVFTPILTLLIGGVGFIFVIMPITGMAMGGLTNGINALTSPNMNIFVKIIVGFLLGAFFLPTVMLGLHRGFDAIYATYVAKKQAVPIYPVFAMADAAQAGVGLAIFLKAKKSKHKRLEENAMGGVIPQVFGVSEPLVYGVTLPLVKPFVTVGIGAGIAGAFIMATGVGCTAYGASGLMAIPMMIYVNGVQDPVKGMIIYVIGWLIAVICGFISTWFFVKEKDLNKVPR